MTGFFVAPIKQLEKEEFMQMVLGVLFVRLIVEIVGKQKPKKDKVINNEQEQRVIHPAEFALR